MLRYYLRPKRSNPPLAFPANPSVNHDSIAANEFETLNPPELDNRKSTIIQLEQQLQEE